MMANRRAIGMVATGARLVVGVVIAVGCVVGVGAAVVAPWPEIAHTPASTQVSTVPGDPVLVCTGPFRVLGRDAQDAQQMQSAGDAGITVDGDPVAPEQAVIATPDLNGGSGAAVFTGAVEERESSEIAAAESLSSDQADLTGYAAAPCAAASTQSWIVGGSVETGANDVLVLSNPGSVTATVTLEVFGGSGAPTTTVIPAQTQIALPFASIAAGADAPVVRVTAEGAPVRAVLQSALTRTLDPAGSDLQGSVLEASETLRFAGVQVVAAGAGTATDALRLLAVDADTVARVVVRDEAGDIASEFTVPLTAATPLDVALADLDLGVYRVEVSASAAVVGAVWQSEDTASGTDFAWMTPAAPITEALFAVPGGPAPTLHVVNDTDAEITVALEQLAGSSREITVAAGESESVPVGAGAVYRLTADGEVAAAVTMTASGRLAGWPVASTASTEREITVYP